MFASQLVASLRRAYDLCYLERVAWFKPGHVIISGRSIEADGWCYMLATYSTILLSLSIAVQLVPRMD
jgi:hypothetical protein